MSHPNRVELDHEMRNAGGLVIYRLVDWDGAPPETTTETAPHAEDDEMQALIRSALVASDEAREANEQELRAAGLW